MQLDLIPLHPNEKRPFGDDWRNRAWSPGEIQYMHEIEGYNLGVRLSAVDLIVDFDIKNLPPESNAEQYVEEFLWRFGIQDAYRVRTVSGGYHVYLLKDSAVSIKRYTKEYGNAVEFKTLGTQVVAPGSTINGKAYTVDEDGPRMLAPQSLMALVTQTLGESGGQEILPIEQIKKMLDLIHAEDCSDYDTWLKIGQAVHSGTNGSIEGRELFADWSSNDLKYIGLEDQTRAKWDSFKSGGSINIHYLKKVMKDLGIEIPRPKAVDDFADLEALGDLGPKPEKISNYKVRGKLTPKEIEGIELAIRKKANILSDSEFDAKMRLLHEGANTEAQMRRAREREESQREKRDKKLAEVQEKIEAAIEMYESERSYKTPGEIFSDLKSACRDKEWGVMGDAVYVLASCKTRVLKPINPKEIGNIAEASGVPLHFYAKASDDSLLETKGSVGHYITTGDHDKHIEQVRSYPGYPISANTLTFGPARAWHQEEPGEYGKIDQFIGMLRPKNLFNARLLKGLLLTLLWNVPGSKPFFTILSTGQTLKEKKETGKTTVAKLLHLIATGDEMPELNIGKERGVDPFTKQIPDIISKRIQSSGMPLAFLLDNFTEDSRIPNEFNSWVESKAITLRGVFAPTTIVRNAFTFIITTNEPALSADLSDRSVSIWMQPSPYKAGFGDDVEAFVRANREDMVKEAIQILKAEPEFRIKDKFTRIAGWQNEILSRLFTEKEWESLKSEREEHLKAMGEELNRDPEVFAEFEEYVFSKLHNAGIDDDKFPSLVIKNSLLMNLARQFSRDHVSLGITARYIAGNAAMYCSRISKKEKCSKKELKNQDVRILQGTGEGVQKVFKHSLLDRNNPGNKYLDDFPWNPSVKAAD